METLEKNKNLERIQSLTGSVKIEMAQKYGQFGFKINGKLKNSYEGCFHTFGVSTNSITGFLNTGLSQDEERYFEKKLGYPEGHLRVQSPFWHEFKVKIDGNGKTLTFGENNDYDKLIFLVLNSDKYIAKSIKELENNPDCDLVMIKTDDKAKDKIEKRNVKIKSFEIVSKMSIEDYRKSYLILSGVKADNLSDVIVRNYVEEFAETNPSMFVAKIGDKDFNDKVLIMELIDSGILKRVGRGLNSPIEYGDLRLGSSVSEVMEFLKVPSNNSIFVEIMQQRNKKDVSKEIPLSKR